MSSHTPGPWTVYFGGKHAKPTVNAATGSIAVLSVRRRSAVAEERTHEQAVADALLIGAAPDLLDALQYAYDTFGSDGSAVWQNALVAIARATGQPHATDAERE